VELGYRQIAIDTMQLEKDDDGFIYVIMLVDLLTKLVYAYPAKDKTSASCRDALISFASLYYQPHEVRVDTDSQLMAADFREMAKCLGIIWTPTYFQRPQANGVERSNGSLKALLRAGCLDDPEVRSKWSRPMNFMPLLSMVNSRTSEETGLSAKLMTFGDVSRLSYALPLQTTEEEIPKAALQALTKRILHVRKLGHENLLKAQRLRRAKGQSVGLTFQKDDFVFHRHVSPLFLSGMTPPAFGPYRILQQEGSMAEIYDEYSDYTKKVHVEDLLPAVITPEQAVLLRRAGRYNMPIRRVVSFRGALQDYRKVEVLVTPQSEPAGSDKHVWVPLFEVLDLQPFQAFIDSLPLFDILSGGVERVRERYRLLNDPTKTYVDFRQLSLDKQIASSDEIIPFIAPGEARKAALLSVFYFARNDDQPSADELDIRIRRLTKSPAEEDKLLTGFTDEYKKPEYASETRVFNTYIPVWVVPLQANYDRRLVDVGYCLTDEKSRHLRMVRLTPPEACAYLSSADDATSDAVISPVCTQLRPCW
jgi:hypothetical protein